MLRFRTFWWLFWHILELYVTFWHFFLHYLGLLGLLQYLAQVRLVIIYALFWVKYFWLKQCCALFKL